MATAALQEAETTARSVELQREELQAVKTQAKLTEDQLGLTRQDFELAGKQFELARDQAQQQLKQAEASTIMAREMQQERELAFRPHISWKIGGGTRVVGVNFDKGPALNTVFCVVEPDEQLWRWHPELVDLSPGQPISLLDDLALFPKQGPPPPRPLVGRTVPPRKVAFCEDQLGNRYRFLPGVVFPDVWHPGETKPDWVTWYEGTAPIAART